jgi:23S rRNA (pseudouridine1915-N3)-methyltransferase
MKLAILAIGRMKSGPETDLFVRYCERIRNAGRQVGISRLVIHEFAESRLSCAGQRRREEAATLLSALDPGSLLVALDEGGSDMTSKELAALISKKMAESISQLAFAIGGPDGHGETLLERANLRLSLGKMTWPHQLVRVMLSEQLYRSVSILSGHPYHRD